MLSASPAGAAAMTAMGLALLLVLLQQLVVATQC
jgi:hypothetical protein